MSDTSSENKEKEPKKKRRKRVRSSNKTKGSHCPVPGQTGLTTTATATGKQSGLNDIPCSVNNINSSGSSKDCADRIDTISNTIDHDHSLTLINSREYTETVMNPQLNLAVPATDFAPRNPFVPGTAAPSIQLQGNINHAAPPAWALPLFADIQAIKTEVVKIDKIDKSVNEIKIKMTEMETKVKSLEIKVNECEASCTFISSETEERRNDMIAAKHDIDKLQKHCTHMNETIRRHEDEKDKLNDKIIDLESRSMRENLMFYGIQEEQHENCETLVKDMIRDKLQIDPTDIILDRVHRVGNERATKPRPIVAKFHRYSDRENIRKTAYADDLKKKLKEDNQGVGIQWPQQTREARKAFYAFTKSEENKGNRVRITGTKLYVNNVLKRKYVNGTVYDANGVLTDDT